MKFPYLYLHTYVHVSSLPENFNSSIGKLLGDVRFTFLNIRRQCVMQSDGASINIIFLVDFVYLKAKRPALTVC